MSRTVEVTAVEVEAVTVAGVDKSKHVRIDPTAVVRDQLGAVFMKDAVMDDDSIVEVKARLAQPTKETPAASDDHETLKFEPKPFTKCTQLSVAEMRPSNFRALTGKPSEIPVPSSSSDLTAAWCTQAFRARGVLAGTESVTKVDQKPLGAGEGEFSELVLLFLEVDGEAPLLARTLVAKFSPPTMSDLELSLTFGTEAHFYNDMSVVSGGLVRPETLYVGYLKKRCGKDGYCIIMESAAGTKEKPAYSYKRVDGCGSVEHMYLVMRTLARFHGHWWNKTQKHELLKMYVDPDFGGGPLPRLPVCATKRIGATFIKSGIKALVHCFSDEPAFAGVPKFAIEYAPLIQELRPVLRRRRLGVMRMLYRHPWTLVHGDAHLENIFFGADYEGGCSFIDFGLLQLGPGMGDVATVIGGGMHTEPRRAHERNLIKEYHRALTEDFGVTGYSFERCWEDYEFQLVKPFLQLVFTAPSFLKQRKRRTGMFSTNPDAGSQKLAAMYKALNVRIACALTDHKWKEKLEETPFTSGACCRLTS